MFAKKGRLKKYCNSMVGRYDSMKDAAKQVDLLMRGDGDVCFNIVRSGNQFQVKTVVWQ